MTVQCFHGFLGSGGVPGAFQIWKKIEKKKTAHQNPQKTIWEKKKSPKMTTKARLDPKKKRIRPLGSIPGEACDPTAGWPLDSEVIAVLGF